MREFNLIDEPWVPCIDMRGHRVEFGIRDTLAKSHELREICDDSPLVTAAIHRMLLALLYRAFKGPTDMAGWKVTWGEGRFDGNHAIQSYLDAWRGRFWLLDEKHPFYQMAGLETNRATSANRLATAAASGNNATLFGHNWDDAEVGWSFSECARQLVACQAFALGFGKSGSAVINGNEEVLPYSADAIALRGMNVWLQGKNLFETFMANLIPVDDPSLPPWELDDGNKNRDRQDGKNRQVVSAVGSVDRWTWQSRLVRLIADGNEISRMYFRQGRSADKSAGDSMKVYRKSKEEGLSPIPLSGGRAAWRDSHAILSIPQPDSRERRPETFNLVALGAPNGVFVAQVVGLASAPNKAGKFLLWRHDRMPVPLALVSDANLIERLGTLLQSSEQAASGLYSRTKRMAKLFLSPTAEDTDGRTPDEKDVAAIVEEIDPRRAYWARLERHFFDLLEGLPGDWDPNGEQWKPDDGQTATRRWRYHIKQEAQWALEESIRQLGTTGRAIQAVARVRTDFNDDDLRPPAQKATKAKARGGKRK